MFYEDKDILLRQIKQVAYLIARMLFGKESPRYDLAVREGTQWRLADLLHDRLAELLAAGRLDEAENELFVRLNREDRHVLEVALDFYDQLNELSDQQLATGGFSREEVEQGLADVLAFYGVRIPGLL